MALETFLVDPRRHPRVPARCRAEVATGTVLLNAVTLDIGPGGCQLLSPQMLQVGAHVALKVVRRSAPDTLTVAGRIAWASPREPLRVGVCFSAGTGATNWFERLVKNHPSLTRAVRLAPERISTRAMLYPGHPPGDLVQLTAGELLVLRHLGRGGTVANLRSRLGSRWEASRGALFDLLRRKLVVVHPSEAASETEWHGIMLDAEMVAAVSALEGARLSPDEIVALGAGAGARPPLVQHRLEQALSDLKSGRVSDAIVHLRMAKGMAPGDALITEILDRLCAEE
jgi:Tfp pilus assembly protein PilZ